LILIVIPYEFFNSFPGMDSTLALKKLPVSVRVSWKRLTEGCGQTFTDLIEINSFELR